jgi:predicted permease
VLDRTSELALRRALGGGRRAIVQQVLSESGTLALVGGALGAGLGLLGTRLLIALAPAGTPRIDVVRVDGRVLAFTAALTVGAVLLAGLAPSLRAMREARLHGALREGGRGATVGGKSLGRSLMVVVQVALAVVVLVGAGLLLETFRRLDAADLGFDAERVLAVSVRLPAARYGDSGERVAFAQELERRLGALPGVAAAGAIDSLPLTGFNGDTDFLVEGKPPPAEGQEQTAWIRRVTPGYFSTVGLELRSGRQLRAGDDHEAPRVALVNETLARRYFPGEAPVGRRLVFGDPADPYLLVTVVGVAADVRNFQVRDEDQPAIYFPYAQSPSRFLSVVLRGDGPVSTLAPLVRSELAALDPLLAPAALVPLSSVVDDALAAQRVVTVLMVLFAWTALVLALVGLYGVVSCGVSLRRHEIGVRLALGAGRRRIGTLVIGGSLSLVSMGVAVGLVVAALASQLLSGLLYGVEPGDPVTYGGVALLLVLCAAVAAAVPAARACRVDPLSVLDRG